VVCVMIVVIAGPIIAASSGGYDLETQTMAPDTGYGYGYVWACIFTLPVLMAMWFYGFASKHRDDPEKVQRAWWIMMALVAAFHVWTQHDKQQQRQERGYR
jgi:hypothetical protein